MTYNYKKHEFTAFTEADFLNQGGNGHSIGCGDTFTMPGSATVTMSTWDNDSTLSGDCRDNATDHSGQNAIVDGARVGCQMYAESYHVLKGSDGKTYYMIEIEVEGYNAPGAGDDFFTFYGNVPPAGVELSVVQTCNVSGCWVDFRCLGAGENAPVNEAPTFTNIPANGIFCVDENQTFVVDLAACDADGDALTYEIVGGADAGAFTIDATTGALTFTAGPDYEAPTDGDGNNVYDVTVKVSDGNGGEEIKPLWIKVKDVAENGWIKGRFTDDADCNDNEWNAELCQWDAGIEGATIQLLDLAGNVVATSVTDAHGNYAFDVPAGEYRVKFPAQDNSEFSAQNSGVASHYDSDADENGVTEVITVTAGCAVYNVDTGVKTVTTPENGACIVVEAEDMALCGYRVENNSNASEGQLIKGSACGWASAQTVFDGPAGQYDLKLSVLDECDGNGRICMSVNGQWVLDVRLDQNDGGNGVSNSTFRDLMVNDIDLQPGDVVKIWGLGNRGEYARIDKLEFCGENIDPMTAELGDTVWFDTDKDGIQDGDEIGAAGVTVLLKDAAGNTIDQTETDTNGNYLFSDLAAGDYEVCVVAPGAYAFSTPNGGDVTLAQGESNLDVDTGLVDPGTASLEGRVFCDENGNALDDAEAGIVAVKVELLDDTGAVVATTMTKAGGVYSFTGLDAGDYSVRFDASTAGGKTLVAQDAGDDAIDSDADANGETGVYTLNIGDNVSNVDAGLEVPAGSVSGTYFCDDNDNGADDAGDTDVADKLVTLLNEDGSTTGRTTTTDAQGNYSFADLAPGAYKVMFEAPEGKVFIAQNAGNDDTDDSDVDASGTSGVITIVSGQDTSNVDAGVVVPNAAPEPKADTVMACADETATFNVLSNDMDMDNDILSVLSISDADEMAFVGESLTLDSGAVATLNADGTVSFDGTSAHGDLLVGQKAQEETITYTVSDGNGGTGSSTLDITVCGAASTLEMICESLPAQVDLSIAFDGVDFKVTVADDASTTADDGLASAIWSGACIDIEGELLLDMDLTVNVYGICGEIPDGLIQNPENLDLINWILNEEFVGNDTMDGSAQYSIFDVQEAVWTLSDGTVSSNAIANEIIAKAQADGEGFMAGEGDLVAVIFDPIAPNADVTNTQTFIMGVAWDALALDCACEADTMAIL